MVQNCLPRHLLAGLLPQPSHQHPSVQCSSPVLRYSTFIQCNLYSAYIILINYIIVLVARSELSVCISHETIKQVNMEQSLVVGRNN